MNLIEIIEISLRFEQSKNQTLLVVRREILMCELHLNKSTPISTRGRIIQRLDLKRSGRYVLWIGYVLYRAHYANSVYTHIDTSTECH